MLCSVQSYVGVCLVLALIIIRNTIRSVDKNVGPILTLSYKNHALDEFLVDVLKHNRLKSGGELIRIGKPENVALLNYTEKTSSYDIQAQKELKKRLSVIREAKQYMCKWYSSSGIDEICLVQCWQFLNMFGEMEEVADDMTNDDLGNTSNSTDSDNDHKCFEMIENLFLLFQEQPALGVEMKHPLIGQALHWLPKVPGLSQDCKLLSFWLQGKTPPPRCCYGQVDTPSPNYNGHCLKHADGKRGYCLELHACGWPSCANPNMKPSTPFCTAHRCEYPFGMCESYRVVGSRFCESHCCAVCTEEPRDQNSSVCVAHKCQADMTCVNPQLRPHTFCLEHCCRICWDLREVSSTSTRCNPNLRYCSLHSCSKSNCANERIPRLQFCTNHTCLYCDHEVDDEVDGSFVCREHRCAHEDEEKCPEERVKAADGRESLYCRTHTCHWCVRDTSLTLNGVCAPSFTCLLHPTCQGLCPGDIPCQQLVKDGDLYCEEHDQRTTLDTCSGLTKKEKPCRTKRPVNHTVGIWYCKDHEEQGNKMSRIPPVPAFQPICASRANIALEWAVNVNARHVVVCEKCPSLVGEGQHFCSLHQAIDETEKRLVMDASTPTCDDDQYRPKETIIPPHFPLGEEFKTNHDTKDDNSGKNHSHSITLSL